MKSSSGFVWVCLATNCGWLSKYQWATCHLSRLQPVCSTHFHWLWFDWCIPFCDWFTALHVCFFFFFFTNCYCNVTLFFSLKKMNKKWIKNECPIFLPLLWPVPFKDWQFLLDKCASLCCYYYYLLVNKWNASATSFPWRLCLRKKSFILTGLKHIRTSPF